MDRPTTAAYAKRVFAGQSPDLPMNDRARRVQKALRDQGMWLRDADVKGGPVWAVAVSSVCLRDALAAWESSKDLPMAGKVAAVERAARESGFLLSDVLLASQMYWNTLKRAH